MRLLVLDRPQPQCCGTCVYLVSGAPVSGAPVTGHCTLWDRDLANDVTRLVCWAYSRDRTRGELWRQLSNSG